MKKLMMAFLLCIAVNVWAGACSKMVAFGTPIVQTEEKAVLLCRKLYAVGYSPSRKTAYWAVEKVTVENLVDMTTRKNVFKTDPDIPTISAKPTDYDNSNFDQGHLAPATNMAVNQQAMDQSFYLTNIIPQNSSNNQSGWKKIENYTRSIAKTYGNIYVITGPVYLCNPCNSIGKSMVAIPTHIFKIIYNPKMEQTLTFLVPNEPINTKFLGNYLTTVNYVSSLTKINFFPKSNNIKDAKQLWQVN